MNPTIPPAKRFTTSHRAPAAPPGRLRRFTSLASLLLLLGPLPGVAQAQGEDTGTVSGSVINKSTGNYLDGARIQVEGTNLAALTESGGVFLLPNVPEGPRVLVVTYTGLDPLRQEVEVSAGRTVRVDLALDSEVYVLEPFVVSGEREGRAVAITRQREAPNAVTVMASDEFTNLAGGSVGEFLRNMAGVTVDYSGQGGSDARFIRVRGINPSLSSVTIDGFKAANASSGNPTRAFEIDQVSLQNIETIEVYKAPTPAMDGESIGGSVNLVSKSAFGQKGRRISYTLNFNGPATEQFKFSKTYGAGDYSSRKIRLGGNFMYSDQFLDGKLGLVFTVNAHDYYAPSQRAFAAYTYTNPTGPREGETDAWQRQLQITDGGPQTSRESYSLNMDYRLNENTTFFLRSQLGTSELDNRGRTFSIQTTRVNPGYTDTSMTAPVHSSSQSSSSTSFQWKTGEGTNLTIGAKHRFGPWRIDYSGALGRSENIYRSLPRGIRSISLSGNTNISYSLAGSRGDPTPAFTQLAGRDVWDIDSYTRMTASDEEQDGLDKIRGLNLNIRRDFEGRIPFYLQSGLSLRSQRRDIRSGVRNYSYVGPDGVANTADDNTPGSYAKFYDDVFVNRPFPEYGAPPWGSIRKVGEDFYANPQAYVENVTQSIQSFAQGLREAEEDVTGAYLMGDFKLGRFGILGGIRYEDTDLWASGAIDDVQAGRDVAAAGGDAVAQMQARFADRSEQTTKYDNLFPNVQLRYSIRENLIARASYTETIGRPEFSQVFPGYTVNPDYNNGQGRITQSGTSLDPQSSQNYDLGLEFYFEPVGVLSVGVFRKDVDDYIRSVTDLVDSGPDNGFDGQYEGYELVTKTNAGSAKFSGFEFNYSQQLAGVASWLMGFSVFANYTYLKTEGEYDGSKGELEGFFPRTGNVGVSYRGPRLFLSTKYNWRGRAISSVSLNRHFAERGMVDVSMNYKFYRQHAFFVEVKNIFSEPTDQYIDIPGRNGRYYSTPAQINFGFKGQF